MVAPQKQARLTDSIILALRSTKPPVTNTTVPSTVKEVSILMQECQTYQKYFEYIYTFWLGWNLLPLLAVCERRL